MASTSGSLALLEQGALELLDRPAELCQLVGGQRDGYRLVGVVSDDDGQRDTLHGRAETFIDFVSVEDDEGNSHPGDHAVPFRLPAKG